MVPNRETIMKVKLASVGSLVLFTTEFRGEWGSGLLGLLVTTIRELKRNYHRDPLLQSLLRTSEVG